MKQIPHTSFAHRPLKIQHLRFFKKKMKKMKKNENQNIYLHISS